MKVENSAEAILSKKSSSDEPAKGETDFESALAGVLNTHSQEVVSEEELFAALVGRQLVDREIISESEYRLKVASYAESGKAGYMALEDAAKGILGDLLDSEELSGADANEIYSRAFAAAQLDDNRDYLFDHKSSEADLTRAVVDRATALEAGLRSLEAFINEADDALERSVREHTPGVAEIVGSYAGATTPVTSQNIQGPLTLNGFVFKPESESDGNLVVLAPYSFTGNISKVQLTSAGEIIEEGRFSGIANGNRSHFRFTKPGRDYPDDIAVQMVLDDGSMEEFLIRNPAERKEL